MALDVTLDGGMPWGFRIQGGIDKGQPIQISRVNPASKASKEGLQEGDIIETINGQATSKLRNNEAHQLIRNTLDRLRLSIKRSPKKSDPSTSKMFRSSTSIEVNSPTTENPGEAKTEPVNSPQSPHSTTIILNPIRTGYKHGKQNSQEVVVDGEPNGIAHPASGKDDASGTPARQVEPNVGRHVTSGQVDNGGTTGSSPLNSNTNSKEQLLTPNTRQGSGSTSSERVWSPGSSPTVPRTILKSSLKKEETTTTTTSATSESGSATPVTPVWKPFGQGNSPEKPQFKSVKIDPSTFSRPQERTPPAQENGTTYPPPAPFANTSPPEEYAPCVSEVRPPPCVPPKTLSLKLPTTDSVSTSTPHVVGTSSTTRESSPPAFTRVNPAGSRLPPYQSPTITLLQKAREGQIPRGAVYIDHKMNSKEERQPLPPRTTSIGNWWDGQFAVKSEEVYDDRIVTQLEPKKFEGIGPVVKGVPIALCTGVKDENKAEWYKRMYKSLHRTHDGDGRIPYSSGKGYMSEPEPERDDDYYYRKYATLDRRKTRDDYYDSQLRNGNSDKSPSVWNPPSARYSSDIYKNQPKKIEDYEPGRSSIAEMEAKMHGNRANPEGNRPSHAYMFKDGYESDSTLVYRKRGPPDSLSPNEQRAWYKEFQKGGDIPLSGFRRQVPEKPAGRFRAGAVSGLKERYEKTTYGTWRQPHIHCKSSSNNYTKWHLQKSTARQPKPASDDNQLWVLLGPSKSSPNLLVDLDASDDAERYAAYSSTPDGLDTLSDASYNPGWGWSSGFAVHDRGGRQTRMPDIRLFSPRKYQKQPFHYSRMSRSVEDFRKTAGRDRSPARQASCWPDYLRTNAASVTGAVQAGITQFENGAATHHPRTYTYSPLISSTPLPSPRMLSPNARSSQDAPRPAAQLQSAKRCPVRPPPRRHFRSRKDSNHLQSSIAATRLELDNMEFGFPLPPPKVPLIDPDGPHRYQASEVNIHYRSPIQNLEKEFVSDEEIRRRQEQMMIQFYEEERRKKALQELVDIENRRHNDNFTPSQKSPIALNRYDNLFEERPMSPVRARTPEPKTAAKALYNFKAQSAKELSFIKGDIIFIHRKIDKNWYEGEHHGLIGLFPVNHVEIIQYDSTRLTARKGSEGQARARYNFHAQTPMELSLIKGESVILTRKVDQNWYEGRIGALKGIFPASYIEVLSEPGVDLQDLRHSPISKPVASPVSHSLIMNGALVSPKYNTSQPSYSSQRSDMYSNPYATVRRYGPARPPGPVFEDKKHPLNQTLHIQTQSDPIPRYRAIYAYKPQNDDELELHEGDTVYVMEKCDDGWYVGSSQRTGLFGTFPGNYVERI